MTAFRRDGYRKELAVSLMLVLARDRVTDVRDTEQEHFLRLGVL